jgi:hypothetical protein
MSSRWKTGSHAARRSASSRPSEPEKTGWWKTAIAHLLGLFRSTESSHLRCMSSHSSVGFGQATWHSGRFFGVISGMASERLALSAMKRTPW